MNEDDRCTCGRATSPRFVAGTHHAQKCPMYDHPFEPRPEDWKISEEGGESTTPGYEGDA